MNDSVPLPEADVAEQIVSQARPVTKMDIKRAQAYQERRRRLINNGTPPDKVDATIEAEDYQALPVEKKLLRFQTLVGSALRGLQQDVLNLQHNDRVIADAMDVNLRAMGRALTRLGFTEEMQKDIVTEVENEIRRDQEAKQKAASATEEKAGVEAQIDTPPPAESDLPEEAVVFGG